MVLKRAAKHKATASQNTDWSDSASSHTDRSTLNEKSDTADGDNDAADGQVDGDWEPGQDVQVDHSKILEILVTFLDSSSGGKPIMP